MPHCIVEHANVFADRSELEAALKLCLSVCVQSGVMKEEDVKVRSVESEAIVFGDGRTRFLHLTVSMLAGRSDAQKDGLAQALRDGLRDAYPQAQSISIEVRDMNPASYRKSLA